jgi:hypothetical protein
VRSTDGCCITKCPFITLLLHEFFTPSYGTLTGIGSHVMRQSSLIGVPFRNNKMLVVHNKWKKKLRQRLLRTGTSINGVSAGNDGCSIGIGIFSFSLGGREKLALCI